MFIRRDLRRQQAISRDAYRNWDGEPTVTGALADLVDGIRFEDSRAVCLRRVEVDCITTDRPQRIAWDSGTVGGADGVLTRLVAHQPDISGTVSAGGLNVPFRVTALPSGTELPDGSSAE